MFKTGSIRKIEVKNFVTYTYTVMIPGPNLNLLIGSNGTGKSTIVAAIILGLGGNPKIVGRGTKVSEYVKHNCEEATINIYLQDEDENKFIKITRKFTKQDKTCWCLNNRQVPIAEIKECIKQFNIQVDNLCQFLPQDRVQDFAKLNQQDLLKQTQVALCRDDLIEKQNELVESRKNHQELSGAIEKNNHKLQEAQDANMRLEGKVHNFNKKKKYMERVQNIDRKTAWLQFDSVYAKVSETKEDLNKANKVYEKYKSEAKPAEREVQKAKDSITELQHARSNVTRQLRDRRNNIRGTLDKISRAKGNINEVKNEMNLRLAEVEQRGKEIDAVAAKIEEMKSTQQKLIEKYGNDQQIQERVQKLSAEINKFKKYADTLSQRKDGLVQSKQDSAAQLRALENEKNRLENVKSQRLEQLRRWNQAAYEGVLWLREHRHLFRGEVFEPMMLEINVLDPKNAKYLENIISMRDRVAFTCTSREDMRTLVQHLRDEKNLTVNVLYSGDVGENVAAAFQPKIPIEHLRKYGLYTYLYSLFTAPGPIKSYLCRTYNVHNIPIGTNETNRCFADVPDQFRVFFSDSTRYHVSISRYTGAKSITQNAISSNGSFSISVDVLRLENLNGQLEHHKRGVAENDGQIVELNAQMSSISEKTSKLGEELQYIRSAKSQVQAIDGRVVAMQRKMEEIRRMSINVESIKVEASRKIQKAITSIGALQDDLKSTLALLNTSTLKSALYNAKIQYAQNRVNHLENQMLEIRQQMQEALTTCNRIKEEYANIKGQAKGALQKAKSLSKNFTPDDAGFDEFREIYDALPADFQHLSDLKNQLAAKIDLLSTADDDEMRQYESRVELIQELQSNIEKGHVGLSKIKSRIETLREEWLGPLKVLISEINFKFASAFERMGCAGEVSLNTGDDKMEFAKYGLSIKVTYRNGEPLQQLNNVVQSGGERAVATAAFMLALQEMTPVPFRCVDEINQGMDANNERRIFDLLFELTNQDNTAQYFLITPKLIPNLNYTRSTMIHVVHNGPFVEEDRKWFLSTLCNPQRIQVQ